MYAANEVKRILDRLYPLRKCSTLPNKVCLYYHLGQCLAPCVFDVEASKYKEMQDEIVAFLNGGYKTVKNDLMKNARSRRKYGIRKSWRIPRPN